jgi:hypothetical protein
LETDFIKPTKNSQLNTTNTLTDISRPQKSLEDGALGLKTKRLIAALADIGGRRCFAITTWFQDRLPNRSTTFWYYQGWQPYQRARRKFVWPNSVEIVDRSDRRL